MTTDAIPTMRKAAAEDVRRVTARPFALTRGLAGAQAGFGHPISRLEVGEFAGNGREAVLFDVKLRPGGIGSDDSQPCHYTAAFVQIAGRADGRVSVSRRGFLREPVPLSSPEVEVAAERVQKRFRVRATSPELAHALLDDGPLAEWLGERGGGFHYELAHDRVLAYGRRRLLMPRTIVLEAAMAFAERIPARALGCAPTALAA